MKEKKLWADKDDAYFQHIGRVIRIQNQFRLFKDCIDEINYLQDKINELENSEKMKVYIVSEGEHEDIFITGVFSSEEKAKKFTNRVGAWNPNLEEFKTAWNPIIEEFEIDEIKEGI